MKESSKANKVQVNQWLNVESDNRSSLIAGNAQDSKSRANYIDVEYNKLGAASSIRQLGNKSNPYSRIQDSCLSNPNIKSQK